MPSSNRHWKGNFIDRFVKTSPAKSDHTTERGTANSTASGSFDRTMEQLSSNSFQRKDSCGASCRCHAGDHFPDASRCSNLASRPSAVRLLSMIHEGLPKTPSDTPSQLSLYSTNSTSSSGTSPSRRQSLYMPSDRRPVYEDNEECSGSRPRGRKSSELSMYRTTRCRGMSPRPSLDFPFERSRPYGEA